MINFDCGISVLILFLYYSVVKEHFNHKDINSFLRSLEEVLNHNVLLLNLGGEIRLRENLGISRELSNVVLLLYYYMVGVKSLKL